MALDCYFKALMTVPCKVYNPTYVKQPDGTSIRSFGDPVETLCNFHSTSVSRAEFADKIGEQTAYVVCLPLGTPVASGSFIEIGAEGKYLVVGVRKASRKFETIAEVVAHE